ncbi:hypothetical protein RHMOL_Rhmol02G0166400 [Rhododendron molle]|uniref:Uncharacterized protein n=1 Tax=Rhododendron molle TaxID=49168 RepID=A0ACC0PSM3_RHOML|nr:hypothetical protein RHMOL_Rhmol02G0166400 [Rhododendron molle]
MVSMTSLCGRLYTISTNKREGNVHHLLRKVNKIALLLWYVNFYSFPTFFSYLVSIYRCPYEVWILAVVELFLVRVMEINFSFVHWAPNWVRCE